MARHEIITKAAKLTTISKALHNECSFAVIALRRAQDDPEPCRGVAVFVPIAKGCRDGHVGTSQTLLV